MLLFFNCANDRAVLLIDWLRETGILIVPVGPFVAVEVFDETDVIDGEGSCPVDDERLLTVPVLLVSGLSRLLLPAFARVSVMLLL